QPIDALFPVEIKVTDASGSVRYHVWRTGGPDVEKMFKIAANDVPGKWTMRVKELVSGRISETDFTVTDDAPPVKLRVNYLADKVMLHDEYPVWNFLRNNQVEGPIYIVLGPKQERYRPLAIKLKKALEAAGNKAEVKVFSLKGARRINTIREANSPLRSELAWFDKHIPGQGWPSVSPRVMRNVIVFATLPTPEENDMAKLESDMAKLWFLYKHPTPNYPVPGAALIQYQWSPFVFNYDVVHVFARDEDGLRRGVDKLIEVSRIAKMDREPTTRRDFRAEGPVVGGKLWSVKFAPAAAEPQTAGQRHSRKSYNFLLPERMGVPIREAAVSRDGKFIAVTTDGYGENIFLLSSGGKLMWSKKVGVMHARTPRFSRDGRKVQCRTNQGGGTHLLDTRTGRIIKEVRGGADLVGIRKKEEKKKPAFPPEVKIKGNTISRGTAWSYKTPAGQKVRNVAVSEDKRWLILNAWTDAREYWHTGKPILVFIDYRTGDVRWTLGTKGIKPGHNKVGLLAGGIVILQDSDAQGRMMFNLLSPRDGSTIYSYVGLPGGGGSAQYEISPDGSYIMLPLGGADPQLRVVFLKGKKKDRAIRFGEAIRSFELMQNGKRVLVASWDSHVYLVEVKTGKTIWKTPTNGGPRAMLTADRKRVLVTTHVGWVYFLDAGSGRELWKKDLNGPEAQPNLRQKLAKWVKRDDNLRAE
ncbi:MAG: PQQ-binding-like beta-propeller repeat protein, partial [Planctomycetia bacterium]|nr:PQQ-binding-like beta-propeller repeat protein [Planctomycetia bacterium]